MKQFSELWLNTLCSWKITLKYKHKYPILNARGSSTKDCCKGNIHLKSSFQFTFNRKLEMSLGNHDNNKKLIPEWTQAYLMISTNFLKTAHLKGKIPFWNINIQNVNPVKKIVIAYILLALGFIPLCHLPTPSALFETAGGEGHRGVRAVCGQDQYLGLIVVALFSLAVWS